MKNFIFLTIAIIGLGLASPAHAGNKLFVGGLSWDTTDADLVAHHLSRFGVIVSVVVHKTDDNGYQSAEATVEFEDPAAADRAAAALDGKVVGDRVISAKTREIVVVGSKVKEVIREAGFRSDGELVQAVSDKVHEILEAAIGRAGANKRGTVRPYDL
jgi:hypothetical protein